MNRLYRGADLSHVGGCSAAGPSCKGRAAAAGGFHGPHAGAIQPSQLGRQHPQCSHPAAAAQQRQPSLQPLSRSTARSVCMLNMACTQHAMLRSVGQHTSAQVTCTMAVAIACLDLKNGCPQHASLLGLVGLTLLGQKRAALPGACRATLMTTDCRVTRQSE